uniref:Protein mahjong n=2 Tax=Cacopsylla melanoneura TaxID=428564 RepID=A0A8D8ZHS1_9HEMI
MESNNGTSTNTNVSKEAAEVALILRTWEESSTNNPEYDPIPLLITLAEKIEEETENYFKGDPDPFDERHPSRADPNCALGHILKVLFKKDNFMNKLVHDYIRATYYSRLGISGRDHHELNVHACRLMLDMLPGLEAAAVYESPINDSLVQTLFSWAENSVEPLQTYATGLLAAAMEVQEIATNFKELNTRLVPLMLDRLRSLTHSRPFSHLGQGPSSGRDVHHSEEVNFPPFKKRLRSSHHHHHHHHQTTPLHTNFRGLVSNQTSSGNTEQHANEMNGHATPDDLHMTSTEAARRQSIDSSGMLSPPSSFNRSDASNSSWAELEPMIVGTIPVHPLTTETQQLFILKYLTPMGEYQEFISHVFEKSALDLILTFISMRESKNSRLAFEALKYLAALLCHKKFSIEFINLHGLQRLLEVPRPSMAATGVSICFYYLAYCEDAMERVCTLPRDIISELVRYACWLLECSHDSGRCHATMFFGLTFKFRVILEEFDAQNGLRMLYNVMSTLDILAEDESVREGMSEDAQCSARQIVRHVAVALKKYLEAHLFLRVESIKRETHVQGGGPSSAAGYCIAGAGSDLPPPSRSIQHANSVKLGKSTPEEIQDNIELLMDYITSTNRTNWKPVDQLIELGGVKLLLQIIAFAYEWNYSGRSETVRCALDVLNTCAVLPRAQLLLCEQIELPEDTPTVGMNIVLGAAEGEIVADPDVQKAALYLLITCIYAPSSKHQINTSLPATPRTPTSTPSSRKSTSQQFQGGSLTPKTSQKSVDEQNVVTNCVRSNNGIMVLLTLMTVKTPITDADSIRGLACRALAGLAKHETVRQIMSKLPLFTSGQLQNLMRDPILQDKRQEHVMFQKYGLELMERVSGGKHNKNSTPGGGSTSQELEISMANIHRAHIIAQTKIHFNDRQLLQLIHEHFLQHGLPDTAAMLQREANLPPLPVKPSNNVFLSPFSYSSHYKNPRSASSTPSRISHTYSEPSIAQGVSGNLTSPRVNTPIRLSIKKQSQTSLSSQAGSSASKSLQKQISGPGGSGGPSNPGGAGSNSTGGISLDSIITEYLTNQHALCKNPMVTCPEFNLFVPHKCPDPKPKNHLITNFTARHTRGIRSRRLNHRLIHSRFCPTKTIRADEDDTYFSCCAFMGNTVLASSNQGKVYMYSTRTAEELLAYSCHESYISNLDVDNRNNLLLTSSTWRRPLSALWSIRDGVFEFKHGFHDEELVLFSHQSPLKIIGTKGETAVIYDGVTGKKVITLTPALSNQYNKNRAVFSPTDELVLSDGVLWDVTSGKEIHKFDKLNQSLSGVFHPNNLEIVSNTEVWDLRTFHLLRTVSQLDQCAVKFSSNDSAIYAFALEPDAEEDPAFESSFKTLDAYDYSSIATVEVKKNIYDLSLNRYDTILGIVENTGVYDGVDESTVRLYDVGRRRDDDDDVQEDEDDEEDMNNTDSSTGEDDDPNDDSGDDLMTLEDVLLNGWSSEDEDDDDDEELEEEEEDSDEDDSDYEEGEGGALSPEDLQKRMKEALDHKDVPGMDSGCTAVVVLFVDNQIYIANAGDSRAVLCRGTTALDLSEDHKPEDDVERARIVKAGGEVTPDGRVNGGLNLSRALGDHSYKQTTSLPLSDQMITALPDVTVQTLQPDDQFIIIACDGIWNSLSSQEVVDFVRERIDKPDKKLSAICEELFDKCLAPDSLGDGTGCDNMTCVLVRLHGNRGPVESHAHSSSSAQAATKRTREEEEEAETKPSAKKTKTEGNEAAEAVAKITSEESMAVESTTDAAAAAKSVTETTEEVGSST